MITVRQVFARTGQAVADVFDTVNSIRFTPEPILTYGTHLAIWGTTTDHPEGWPGHSWYCHLDGRNAAGEDWTLDEALAYGRVHVDTDHRDTKVTFREAQIEDGWGGQPGIGEL